MTSTSSTLPVPAPPAASCVQPLCFDSAPPNRDGVWLWTDGPRVRVVLILGGRAHGCAELCSASIWAEVEKGRWAGPFDLLACAFPLDANETIRLLERFHTERDERLHHFGDEEKSDHHSRFHVQQAGARLLLDAEPDQHGAWVWTDGECAGFVFVDERAHFGGDAIYACIEAGRVKGTGKWAGPHDLLMLSRWEEPRFTPGTLRRFHGATATRSSAY